MKTDFVQSLQHIVETHGDRLAVWDNGEEFSFRRLWDLSTHIATGLQRVQVAPETVVAIQLPKSAGFVASLIAVWRCRAAWVPIDPSLPGNRIEFLRSDSAASLVIDNDWLAALGKPTSTSIETPAKISRDHLAYVIYTSGTTGQPKGVEVTHRGLVSMLQQQIELLKLNPDSRSLFLLSCSFDASVSDIGTALLSGASLWIDSGLFTQGLLTATPTQILDALRRHAITYVDIPPSILAKLHVDDCPKSLSTILIGGEVCPADVIRTWAAKVRLLCVYGPTEATVCTSVSVCDSNWERPLIGKPLNGVQYVVDNETQTWEKDQGELLIGGIQVARGYRDQPKQTNGKFIRRMGQVFYRTGDLVRQDNDGEYVFVGRIDRQVKINGHRIELEEIEQTILSHPDVDRAAVVLAARETTLPKQIVAFVETNGAADEHDLRSSIRDLAAKRLPRHLRPGPIQFVSPMPLTHSGKPDLSVLRQLPIASPNSVDICQLRGVEKVLSQAFHATLGHSQFDRESSFFDLGGDSLGAMEVAAFAQAAGVELTPHVVATRGSILQIAAGLEQGDVSQEAMSAESLRRDIAEFRLATISIDDKPPRVSSGQRMLLTGATGFLGARLLRRFIQRHDSQVTCLVRAADAEQAQVRLEACLQRNRIVFSEKQWDKIELLAGDISKARLGLSQQTYDELANKVDHVVHAAAEVSSAKAYSQLRPTNVVGTWEVIKFATVGAAKKLDYVSTLSVFVGTDRCRGVMSECDDLTATKQVYGGYAQSKWASEILVDRAKRWIPQVRIFRLGLLTTDMQSGIYPGKDLLTLSVRGCLQLGVVPRLSESLRFDVTPVDFAADVLHSIINSNSKKQVFHIAHPLGASASELCNAIQAISNECQLIDAVDFPRRVVHSDLDPVHVTACLAFAKSVPDRDRPHTLDLFQATDTHFEMTNTRRIMADAKIEFVNVDAAFLQKMISPMNQNEPGL